VAVLFVQQQHALLSRIGDYGDEDVAADGTLIEGSVMMSPLLQAAQAHFVEEEMRQLAAPKTEHEPETSPPPSLPEFIALSDESVVPSESVALESTFPSAPRTVTKVHFALALLAFRLDSCITGNTRVTGSQNCERFALRQKL
jgi:hypothetical protein